MSFDPNKHLSDLRGKQYLEVKWRIVWFRDQHPGGAIVTEIANLDPPIVKAIISNADGVVLASGIGTAKTNGKKVVWSGREFEKAETAAIGRALAHAGFGTQFTGETEGDDIADAPVKRSVQPKSAQPDPKYIAPATNNKPRQWSEDANFVQNMADELGLSPKAVLKSIQHREESGVITAQMDGDTAANILRKAKANAGKAR